MPLGYDHAESGRLTAEMQQSQKQGFHRSLWRQKQRQEAFLLAAAKEGRL